MSDFDELLNEDVIGRGDVEAAVEKVKEVVRGSTHPLVPIEVLERPSPQPFSGRPDPDYPELDSGEPLYIPRFLVRRWGAERFRRSAYYSLWKDAADRQVHTDAKPSSKKS